MTQIKGYQIAPNTVDASEVFKKDQDGNVIFPTNIKFGNLSINDIQSKVGENLLKKVEKLVKNSDGNFELSENPIGDVQIFVNGLIQTPGDDFSIDNTNVNFVTEPQNDDKIVAVYNYKINSNNTVDNSDTSDTTDTSDNSDTTDNSTNSSTPAI